MSDFKKLVFFVLAFLVLSSCGGFKAKRVTAKESDEKAMGITDKWVAEDTVSSVKELMEQMEKHKGLRRYLAKEAKRPRIFIGEFQNLTAEPYFPVEDLTEELLSALSATGEYVLIDSGARAAINEELRYQQDGNVDPNSAKSLGKQKGADVMIFGSVHMRPATRDGKTLKEFSVNIRFTDVESGEEVMRGRTKIFKYSERKSMGW